MQGNQPLRRRNFWTPFLFFLLLIVGIIIGFYLNIYLNFKRPIETVIERNDRIEEIIDLVDKRFVDSVNRNTLYLDAINGILQHLDPHTRYIPVQNVQKVNEGLEGNFKGIGVGFIFIKDTLVISNVILNSPAKDADLKVGDKILSIDSKPITGKELSNQELTQMVLGPENSKIRLTILRYGEQPKEISVKRGIVPLYSITSSYMMDNKTGYLKIERFSATTYREFLKAMEELQSEGMKQLILDLRYNPGGYIDAATSILDEFIDGNKLLVYTKDRTNVPEEILADKYGIFEDGKLIVLINEESASASEIFAGSIQDWDRGIVVGRRSYGKGLVQEQFTLTDGSALRLTVARYYTPSGRNIQKEVTGKQADSATAYYPLSNTLFSDKFNNHIDTSIYFTLLNGRVVQGGGGIQPDEYVRKDQKTYSMELYDLIATGILSKTVYDYYSNHNPEFLNKYKTLHDFYMRFQLPIAFYNQLKTEFEKAMPNEMKMVWRRPDDLKFLQTKAKAQFASIIFGNNGYDYYMNTMDSCVLKGQSILYSSQYSRLIGR